MNLLIVDTSSLAYRAVWGMKGVEPQDAVDAVSNYVLAKIIALQKQLGTDRVAWCFDGGHSKRKAVNILYKDHKLDDPESRRVRSIVGDELRRLREVILPELGFRNIFQQQGYEGDDLIAWLCENQVGQGDRATIVSSDNDLYQLLREIDGGKTVDMWLVHADRLYTARHFAAEYRIDPKLWVDVKAIAGCQNDNVEGIRGVGHKLAIRFLTNTLNPDTKVFKSIVAGNARWRANLPLVQLPFSGLTPMKIRSDRIDQERWKKLLVATGHAHFDRRPA